jgi:hypothetical protein
MTFKWKVVVNYSHDSRSSTFIFIWFYLRFVKYLKNNLLFLNALHWKCLKVVILSGKELPCKHSCNCKMFSWLLEQYFYIYFILFRWFVRYRWNSDLFTDAMQALNKLSPFLLVFQIWTSLLSECWIESLHFLRILYA